MIDVTLFRTHEFKGLGRNVIKAITVRKKMKLSAVPTNEDCIKIGIANIGIEKVVFKDGGSLDIHLHADTIFHGSDELLSIASQYFRLGFSFDFIHDDFFDAVCDVEDELNAKA